VHGVERAPEPVVERLLGERVDDDELSAGHEPLREAGHQARGSLGGLEVDDVGHDDAVEAALGHRLEVVARHEGHALGERGLLRLEPRSELRHDLGQIEPDQRGLGAPREHGARPDGAAAAHVEHPSTRREHLGEGLRGPAKPGAQVPDGRPVELAAARGRVDRHDRGPGGEEAVELAPRPAPRHALVARVPFRRSRARARRRERVEHEGGGARRGAAAGREGLGRLRRGGERAPEPAALGGQHERHEAALEQIAGAAQEG